MRRWAETTSFINLLLMMKAFPALVFSMATVPVIVFSIAALGGGVTLWRDVWAAIREGDPAALAAVMLGLVHALLCTMAVSSMKETIERRRKQKLDDERFEVIRKDQAEIRTAVATIESGQAEAEERSDYIASTMSALARRLRVENIMRPNTYECWTGLTPWQRIHLRGRALRVGSGGGCRGHRCCSLDSRCRAHREELAGALCARHGGRQGGVRSLRRSQRSGLPGIDCEVFASFRTLKQIAAVKRITLDLDRARFLLKEQQLTEVSFFLGRAEGRWNRYAVRELLCRL
ncbi:MAG: hypothetical protein IPL62_19775 [Caulobacteraceae bacterium]|nr:hypothetical protein [Caulobacteraceae bacterium]